VLSLQTLIRNTTIEIWEHASVGLESPLAVKIRNNISKDAWRDFVQYALEYETHVQLDPLSFRKQPPKDARHLELIGEIVLAWNERPSDNFYFGCVNPYESILESTIPDYPRPNPAVLSGWNKYCLRRQRLLW
jgi:hypothetical protein